MDPAWIGALAGAGMCLLGWFGMRMRYESRLTIAERKADDALRLAKTKADDALQEAAEAKNEIKELRTQISAMQGVEMLRGDRIEEKLREMVRDTENRLNESINGLSRRLDNWMLSADRRDQR